ncbi:paeninodin family lasso peptide [Peribacillus sp. FSL H8-0477]|uniref:paeninodin family lasso peptide n=1 Tax=Peribacillus sp. FSL H8-0477 TaxID=2921388 RepID=UPI0030F505D8
MLQNKKVWEKPILEVLSVGQTMASTLGGAFDEGYNSDLGHQGQTGPHHGPLGS